MKIVVDKDIPFIQGVLEPFATVVYLPGNGIEWRDLTDSDALIIRTRTTCDGALLDGTAVRFIGSATIGYDHIDTDYCQQRGITWTNAPGCNSSSVQQYVASALFHLTNKMDFELASKTIGIVGVGNVGSKVARLCKALGMRVLLNDPPRERKEGKGEFVSLDSIVRQSDIVSFHVPLTRGGADNTFHLVDAGLLAKMNDRQILINTSRGEVVDSVALKAALKGRRLAACVLDVWENEPAIDRELLQLVNVATPHIAGYSADGKANGTSMVVRALSRYFGLKLDTWSPEGVPGPQNPTIELDCATLRTQKVFCKLVTRTYDIQADDQRLRNSPGTFEQQRAAYPIRREFPSYSARLKNASGEVLKAVQEIGFTIQPYEK